MRCKAKFYASTALMAAFVVGGYAAIAESAGAQDTEGMETVVVTGFRESLANALQMKQKSNLIMESVTAEDVGKMPDQNIAESLQRLPGIQIDRSQGKGTQVLINGLRQNLTTLNGDIFLTGKEFYVSGEGSGGGSGGNAQYNSLEGIPSEELGRVDVYKSPNAALTEGGLGGIVDLRTRNPLDAPEGFSASATVRGTSTSFASLANTEPVGTLVLSYKPSDRFAITGSISYDNEDTHTKEYESYNRSPWLIANSGEKGYTGAGNQTLTSAYAATTSSYYLVPEYGYFSDIYDQNRTIGATLGATYQVTDAIQTSLNWFYTHISDKNTTYSDKIGFNGSGSTTGLPGINVDKNYDIDENGILESGSFWMTGNEAATLYQHFNSDANNLQWHTSFDNGGPVSATLDVSWARASSNLQAAQQDIEHGLYRGYSFVDGVLTSGVALAPTAPGCNNFSTTCDAGTGNAAVEMNWDNGGKSGKPSANFGSSDILTNSNYVLFKSAWAWANATKQTQDAVRGEAVYKPSFLGSVEGSLTGGFRYSQRDVWQDFGRYLISPDAAPAAGSYIYYQDPSIGLTNGHYIPWDSAATNPNLAKTVKNWALGNVIVKDPVAGGMTDPSTFLETIWNNSHNSSTANNTEKLFTDTLSSFNVHEFKQAYYLMTDLGGKDNNFHLNAGVRVVLTDLTVHGAQSAAVPTYWGTASWNGVNDNNVPVTSHKHSVDVLPSINLTLNITDEQIVRFGAARVMSPQDLFSLGTGNSFNFTRNSSSTRININPASPLYGTYDGYQFATGNSGNPDLDPYRASQFNLAWEDYFAKGGLISVSGFYKQVDNFVETQNLTETVMDDFGGTSGTISKPVNAGNGSIYGLELAGQYALENGFGFATNYTFTQSTSDQVTAFNDHLTIPGVAKNSFTGTVYYEKYGFDTRLSYSWRSKAVNQGLGGSTFSVTDTATSSPKVFGVFTAPYGELDAQVTYNVTDYLSVMVSAQNLTDEAYHTYLQFKNQPFTYDESGIRYFFGVRAKY